MYMCSVVIVMRENICQEGKGGALLPVRVLSKYFEFGRKFYKALSGGLGEHSSRGF